MNPSMPRIIMFSVGAGVLFTVAGESPISLAMRLGS